MDNAHTHDKGYKKLFSNPLILKQLLESFVKMDWVKKVDFNQAESLNTTFISDEYKRREADVIYKLKFKDQEFYLYVLIEFQSTVDSFFALRMLRYVLEFYEYLVKHKVPKKLPIIFPILLYNGDQKWTSPDSLQDLIDQPKELGALKPYLPNFKYFKIIENEFSEKTLMDLENIVSTLFLFETKDKDTLTRLIHIFSSRLKKEDPKAMESFLVWLKNFLSKHIKVKTLNLKTNKIRSIKEGTNMLATTLKNWEAEVLEKGIEKGMERGREEEKKILTRTMLENGFGMEVISKMTGYSIESLKKMKKHSH